MRFIANAARTSVMVASMSLALCTMSRIAGATATVTVHWNEEHQTIDGFGAAQSGGDLDQVPVQDFSYELYCWPNAPSKNCVGGVGRTDVMDLAFSALNGVGLTILRMKVNAMLEALPGHWNYEDPAQVWIMQEAVKRGPVKLIASVWSPPGWMKSNYHTVGGTLRSDRYDSFADFLSHYAGEYASANGVNIYAVSMSNEPDTDGVYWDTCVWTDDQIANFLANYLSPTFANNHIATKVFAPEAASWDSVDSFLTATYNNPAALARVDIVAGHLYGGSPSLPFQTALNAGKKIWQTETSRVGSWTINTALEAAVDIHNGLTGAQISAWVWFGMFHGAIGDYTRGGLIGHDSNGYFAGSPVFYALGNFSKFIRPGFVRIGATTKNEPYGNFYASAYKDPTMGQLVIVAINKNTTALPVKFDVGFGTIATPYVTSSTRNLEPGPDVSLGSTVTVPPMSVVTYVAQPPRLVSDILWRNANGTTMLWLNALPATANYPGLLGSDWQIQGVGDFDGNGKSDILWRCAPQAPATACGDAIAGSTAIWHDGTGRTTWPGALDFNWQIQGVGRFDR